MIVVIKHMEDRGSLPKTFFQKCYTEDVPQC